ncbi:MAG: UDP-4-amino-4,6-dideoxy-N-acetyl-beta-L-altrosamine transaminase [Beggiatoa sp. IS2]|nr:MAG: UDP-4-amino-4,6-dideoxy-N-acetyl-beta-L-altrosamine transaminase [Beggiatoa sp. IS2]
MKPFIPFALPSISEEEIAEVVDTLRSGWLTAGPKVQRFEQDFAEFMGVPYALAVNSCTAGLHLALEAIGVQPGDKVITTPYTFTATAEVIRYFGADPIFVDIDPYTFNIDPNAIKEVLVARPVRAILPMHFGGQACDMDAILTLARRYDVKVVEDAAHALPSYYRGRVVGSLGDLTAYSFYVTKPLVTGEGGMVVTANADYAQRIRTMRLHGINRDVFAREGSNLPSWYYEVIAPGFKYNMTDIAAAMGIHQLRKVQAYHQRRQAIADQYTQGLTGLPVRTPSLQYPDNIHAWHLYVVQLELAALTISRDTFIEQMAAAGIGTSVHFIPLHIQPFWRDRYGFKPGDFPTALAVYQRAVSLPIYPRLTDDEVQHVISTVRHILMVAQK